VKGAGIVIQVEFAREMEHMASGKTKKSSSTVALEQRKSANRRSGNDRRIASTAVATERRVGERRAKVNRRRQIDPTTCERDYSDAELEFMHAMDLYKRSSGRMFPTCSEVLEVLRDLGYEKGSSAESVGEFC
jgi:tRNA U54 and U55 pseudouridine synthase Pus10